jgi:Tol biopolymer transport system component
LVTVLVVVLSALSTTASAAPQVVTQPGALTVPAWSRDGKEIAWVDDPMGNVVSPPSSEIWEARADGSRPREVLHGGISLSEGVSQLDWLTPRILAFLGNFSIYLDSLGARPKLVVANVTDNFSSDAIGAHFAYEKSPCGGQCSAATQVVVINRLTGKRSIIGDGTTHYGDPSLSPDGSHVAFGSPDGLLVSRIDGSGLHRIAARPAGCPQWSPDGRNVLYVSDAGSLSVVPASGGTSTVLIPRDIGCGLGHGWSPNGKTVSVIGPVGTGTLTLIDLSTRQKRTLPYFTSVTGVAWSPDSAQLLVTARRNPSACSSLWRVEANGSHRTLIARCGS